MFSFLSFILAAAVIYICSGQQHVPTYHITPPTTTLYNIEQLISIQLSCEVIGLGFSVSKQTIRWNKRQSDEASTLVLFDDHKPQLLKSTYKAMARYNASYETTNSTRFLYLLLIEDCQPEDSGLYICEIIDEDQDLSLTVSYTINVIVPYSNASITNIQGSNSSTNTTSKNIQFTPTSRGYLECTTQGGYPQPNVIMLINGTGLPLDVVSSRSLSTGLTGFQRPSYSTSAHITYLNVCQILMDCRCCVSCLCLVTTSASLKS